MGTPSLSQLPGSFSNKLSLSLVGGPTCGESYMETWHTEVLVDLLGFSRNKAMVLLVQIQEA